MASVLLTASAVAALLAMAAVAAGPTGGRRGSSPFLGLDGEGAGPVAKGSTEAAATCAGVTENCWVARCCQEPGQQCFMKDEMWAGCAEECRPGVHDSDPPEAQTPWKCFSVPKEGPVLPPGGAPAPGEVSGKRADGRYPTLFCFAVIRTGTYELALLRAQFRLRAGIFGCEDWAVLSDDPTELTGGVHTIPLGDLSTGAGVETHFANTDIFSRGFDLLKQKGQILEHDFVVKVDPDAVFLPTKLKEHIRAAAPSPGANVYFQNCKFQDKLWMFGAVEVLSQAALQAYFGGRDSQCKGALDYNNMGEDTFLSRCLDHLGVQSVQDFDLLADGYCSEAPGTCQSGQVAYHPFKDPLAWETCFKAAMQR